MPNSLKKEALVVVKMELKNLNKDLVFKMEMLNILKKQDIENVVTL